MNKKKKTDKIEEKQTDNLSPLRKATKKNGNKKVGRHKKK